MFLDASVGDDLPALRAANWSAGRAACSSCGMFLDVNCTNPGMQLSAKGRKFDLSCTFDLREVAKESFKQMCEELGFTGVAFKPLTTEPGFYRLVCTATIALATEHMPWIQRGKKCKTCGMEVEVVLGGSPIHIAQSLGTDFAWSDIGFGHRIHRVPLTIVSPRVKAAIRERKLRSVDFQPVYLAE